MDRNRKQLKPSLFKQRVWKESHNQAFTFYCPLCMASRRIPMHPKAGQPIHFIRIGLLTLVFTLLTWDWFGPKGLVAFVPFWIVFEVFYRAKVRVALACNKCGFDPALYLVDTQKAREAVQEHWSEIIQSVKAQTPRSSLDSEESRS
jgi:hypothetical protein